MSRHQQNNLKILPQASLHPVRTPSSYYVDVILPLAIARAYTYHVPEELIAQVQPCIRVEVQFGKSKLYTGLVMKVHHQLPEQQQPKSIISIIDDALTVTEASLDR